MAYTIELKASAEKEFKALPLKGRRLVLAKLRKLETDPRGGGAIKLSGADDAYRIRAGDYRIIYQIVDDRLLVYVIRVRHRREAYR